MTSISVETILGLSFPSILRKDVENAIVFKTLDENGIMYDFNTIKVELTSIKNEFSERIMTQLANDGAFILILVPNNLRQTTKSQLKVVFTTDT